MAHLRATASHPLPPHCRAQSEGMTKEAIFATKYSEITIKRGFFINFWSKIEKKCSKNLHGNIICRIFAAAITLK